MPPPSVAEILHLAERAVAADVPDGKKAAATIAKRIGLPYQRVYRWFEPAGSPDAEGLLAILDAFGWLSIPEDARAAAGLTRDPQEAVAAALTVVAENLALVLDALDVPEDARRQIAVQPPRRRAAPKAKR